jgi:hypothetical protein
MNRREFFRVSALGAGTIICAKTIPSCAAAGVSASRSGSRMTVADLPKGSAPQPVPFPHFPSRLHAFVWRNWPLVPTERIAAVVGAPRAEIIRLGQAMGLGRPPRLRRDLQRRSYLTVIRRNWHLLPYDQLLQLLGWTPDQLAYTLREDDFFFIKLGSLKPQCPPLRWAPSDEAAHRREQEIAQLVRSEFSGELGDPADPLFSFVERLSAAPKTHARALPDSSHLRFAYSYFALYGDPLLDTEADPYPEGYLARLADAGANGVWLQAVLYKLARFPWQPELSEHFQERLENLRRLTARARRHGLKVFLYLNEPRAMPLAFFETRPQLKGVAEGAYATLCTSVPEVQQTLVESVAAVCRAVPDLGGFFTITASENLTNCWSHHGGAKCPRCGRRAPAEVIAEANGLFAQGIRQAGSSARLIAWDWGWDDAWAEGIISRLPNEVALMSVSEWSLPIERGGVKSAVGEYSISAVGPGPRAQRHWTLARQRGLKTLAKIQTGNTWELSTVPYIPAVENVARHAANLHAAGVEDLMLSWTLGGGPSPNLEAVAEASASGSAESALKTVAERRFGPAVAPAVVTAWCQFSRAFSEFPYHIDVLYQGPQQLGPANLLWADPTGYAATMTGFPYDDLSRWRGIYPPEIFAGQLEKVAGGFDQALVALKDGVAGQRAGLSKAQSDALEGELVVAEAAAIHFRSTANQARFVAARDALRTAKSKAEVQPHLAALERCLADELSLARRLHALQRRDSRLGFEAANQYLYVPVDLMEKVVNCRDLLERWLPAQRQRWES